MIEILTIGDELLCGRTPDTNAGMIARELHAAGFFVQRITTTGDTHSAISSALLACLPETRFIIVTGGLGPTEDDLTASAAAGALGDTIILHSQALAMLRRELERRQRTMNASQKKQALLPSRCTPIANPIGTACGFVMHHADCHYLFLPGVPAEARAMTEQSVITYINKHSGRNHSIRSKTLRIYGLWESIIQEKLSGALDRQPDVSLGFYPHFPEVLLQLTTHGPDEAILKDRLKKARDAIAEHIGEYIYAEGDISLMEAVGRLLVEKGGNVAVAESCTGGLLSHLITSVPGSSRWFERGLVVYSNISKIQLAGVEESMLTQHGAVSAQTAEALARGVRDRAASTYGIGITGIAGPDGGTPEKPVGTVFFAVASPEGCRTYHRSFTGNRDQNKHLSAYTALDLLRRTLLGLSIKGQNPPLNP